MTQMYNLNCSLWRGVLSFLLFCVLVQSVYAAGGHALSEPVYKALESARTQIQTGNYSAADLQTQSLLGNSKLSSYERSQIWNLRGYSFYLQKNYQESIKAYQNVLAEKDTAAAVKLSTQRTLAQLMFTEGRYQKALVYAQVVNRQLPIPEASLDYLMAHCYYQLKRYSQAVDQVKQLIKNHKPRQPKENWLQLLQASYQQQQKYSDVARVLEQLVRYYPNKNYYLALSSVYSQIQSYKKQLVVLEGLYERNELTEANHIKALATLYLQQKLPVKAALVLEESINNQNLAMDLSTLRLQAQSWFMAREDEKALKVLQKAFNQHKDKQILTMLSQTQFRLKLWQDAELSLKRLLKYKLQNPIETRMLLGLSHMRQKEFSAAKIQIEQVVKEGNSRQQQQASQWLAFIELEERHKNVAQTM